MDFNAYSSEVLEWLEGVRKNRGTDAEKTLMLCKNIRDYAREQDDEKLLGYAYYYSGETYYLLNDVDKLFCKRKITLLCFYLFLSCCIMCYVILVSL